MATLYTHADSNIRKTWILFVFFLVFIISLGWIFSYLLDNSFFLVFAVLLSFIQSFISYWYSDKILLSMVAAYPIKKRKEPELYRIVENLSITAGLPMPKVYIINEAQPNAFATGRNPKHAAIAVTTGLLQKLERAELEGVLAHELAHIGNRDMLLGTVVVILVGVVALLSRMFLRMSFYAGSGKKRRSSGRGGGILLLLGIAGAVLAPLVATLIRLAISRKREFLADASGALLTRYPDGLAKALEKISQDPTPLKKADNSTAHLYISNPFRGKSWLTKMFSTHPPIKERIRILRGMKV